MSLFYLGSHISHLTIIASSAVVVFYFQKRILPDVTIDMVMGMDIDEKIRENEKLVFYTLSKFFPERKDDEDLQQLGRIALWKCLVGFDEAKGEFSSYAVKAIRMTILTEINKEKRLKVPVVTMSLDEPMPVGDEPGMVGEFFCGRNFEFVDFEGFMNRLGEMKNKKVKEIVKMMIEGYTLRETAEKLGISKQRVSQLRDLAKSVAARYI